MKAFEYGNPTTLEQAVSLLGESFDEATVLAGGTDLLSLMKDFTVQPRRLVDLGGLKDLRGVTKSEGGWKIGAMTTLDDLLESAVAAAIPALRQAATGIRSPQMRTMGTVGGELLQRPRCWYFRRGLGLLATDGDRSMVEEGDNRYHAIFDNLGPAKFVHPSSLAPALIALGATATVVGKGGERQIDVADLFQIPAEEGDRETTLEPGDILTAIQVPASAPHSATYEVRHRRGLDWPEAAAAVVLQMDGASVKSASIVLGHVAPQPYATFAGKSLVGGVVSPQTAARAAEQAIQGATPLSMNGYKVELTKVAVKRAILNAAGQDV